MWVVIIDDKICKCWFSLTFQYCGVFFVFAETAKDATAHQQTKQSTPRCQSNDKQSHG